MNRYDIFISYRRDGGFETAKLVCEQLRKRGYRVFLDVEALRSGPFNTQLFNFIDNASDFVLIVSKNALDRCHNKGDWVKEEITHAMASKKNIVPIILAGASFPNPMPPGLEGLDMYNGINSSHEYFDAAMDNLCKKLQAKKRCQHIGLKVTAVLLVVAVLAFVAIFISYNKKQEISSNIAANTVSQSSEYQKLQIEREKLKLEQEKIKLQETQQQSARQLPQQAQQQNDELLAKVVQAGNISRVKTMLQKGADPNALNQDGISILSTAMKMRNKEIVLLLLNHNAVANGVDSQQVHDLEHAIYAKWQDVFEKMLKNNKDVPAKVILLAALTSGTYLKALASAGINLAATDNEGNNTLYYGLRSGYPENICILKKAGINAGEKNIYGNLTPLERMIKYRSGLGLYPGESENKQDNCIKQFIDCYPDMINSQYKGNTILHIVSTPDVLEYLLKLKKIDVNSVNADGKTPLHIHADNAALVNLLIKYGADCNIKDKSGATPAKYASGESFKILSSTDNIADVWHNIFARQDYSTATSMLDTHFNTQVLSILFTKHSSILNRKEGQTFLLLLLKKYSYPIDWKNIPNADKFLERVFRMSFEYPPELVAELKKSGVAVIPIVWEAICRNNPDSETLVHGIELGSSPDVLTYGNVTLVDWAINKNDLVLFNKLLDKKISLSQNQIEKLADKNEFLMAIMDRRIQFDLPLEKILRKDIDIKVLEKYLEGRNLVGQKVIRFAILRTGRCDVVDLLFKHGAKIDNECILIEPIQNNDIKMVKLLLDNGANPMAVERPWEKSMLDYAKNNPEITALLKAAIDAKRKKIRLAPPNLDNLRDITHSEEISLMTGDCEKILDFIIPNKISLKNAKHDFIQDAVRSNCDAESLKLLFAYGAKIHSPDFLHYEEVLNNPETFDLMLKNGLKQPSIFEIENRILKRPNAAELMQIIFNNNFKIERRDSIGWIKEISDPELLKVLLKNGVHASADDLWDAQKQQRSDEFINILREHLQQQQKSMEQQKIEKTKHATDARQQQIKFWEKQLADLKSKPVSALTEPEKIAIQYLERLIKYNKSLL